MTPSPQATQGKAFQRRVSTDTDTVFASARPESADKTITRGTDKSVPYKVRSKTQHRTNVARQFPGFVGNFDTGLPEITVSVGAPIRLQKKARNATVSTIVSNRAAAKNVLVGASIRH